MRGSGGLVDGVGVRRMAWGASAEGSDFAFRRHGAGAARATAAAEAGLLVRLSCGRG